MKSQSLFYRFHVRNEWLGLFYIGCDLRTLFSIHSVGKLFVIPGGIFLCSVGFFCGLALRLINTFRALNIA